MRIILALLLLLPSIAHAGELPKKILLDVPFTSQAPYANWKQPYQDACEEAAVVMAAAWVQKKSLTQKIADKMIRELVAYQIKTVGDYKDTNAEQTAKLARDFYKLNTRVQYDVTHEDIRAELARGNIVIAPMAGQLLKNPYYTRPGPAYHMLVFIGYDDTTKELITNDAGTRRGKKYRYSYATIDKALHDWTGSEKTITKGRSAMIVIKKSSPDIPEE
ncbi:C39 family peptidase [Candidatus Uhrbacteria bacterium]|nr:C39 family peptidase [Candidatus Uhrbacteria bacterium]